MPTLKSMLRRSSVLKMPKVRRLLSPCVYAFIEKAKDGQEQRVLYVGSSARGISRFAHHEKVCRAERKDCEIHVWWMKTVSDARLMEAEMIWTFRPPWNAIKINPTELRIYAKSYRYLEDRRLKNGGL